MSSRSSISCPHLLRFCYITASFSFICAALSLLDPPSIPLGGPASPSLFYLTDHHVRSHFPLFFTSLAILSIKLLTKIILYICDLYWPAARLAVEYDSDLAHTGSHRIARDSRRRNEIQSMGVAVVTITKAQAYSLSEFDMVAHQIANPRQLRSILLIRPLHSVAILPKPVRPQAPQAPAGGRQAW